MSEPLAVKINFSLIPECVKHRLISDFVHNYDRFWADPANKAEYQEWSRQRRERSGDARQ